MAQGLFTVADATQFTGDYVDFTDVLLPADYALNPDLAPVITTLFFDTGNTAVTVGTLVVRLNHPGGVASASLLIRNLTDTVGFALDGCNIPVPVRASDGVPWVLEVVTTGKTATASLYIEYGLGTVER